MAIGINSSNPALSVYGDTEAYHPDTIVYYDDIATQASLFVNAGVK